jgi:hypothetical protein
MLLAYLQNDFYENNMYCMGDSYWYAFEEEFYCRGYAHSDYLDAGFKACY